jgi:hypothetical protein
MREYRLRCTGCGATFPDDGVRLDCPNDHAAALLRTEYDEQPSWSRRAVDRPLWRWLPRGRDIATAAQTAVYRSTRWAAPRPRRALDRLQRLVAGTRRGAAHRHV